MSAPEIADWLVSTIIAFGALPSTAYKVAGLFLEQLEKDAAIKEGS